MPDAQINSGVFLALSCEILSSVQTVATTYPDTWESHHKCCFSTPSPQTGDNPVACAHRTSSAAQRYTPPTPAEQLFMLLTEQCRERTDSLSITFSGLRSSDFCRVGKTKSLNSAWDMYRRSGEQLSCKRNTVLSAAVGAARRTITQTALSQGLTSTCFWGFVLLIRMVFK